MSEEIKAPVPEGDVLRPRRALWLLSLGGAAFAIALLFTERLIPSYYGLYITAALLLLALLFHNVRAGEWRYYVATLLNTAAAGCAAGAYFAALALPLSLTEIAVAWLAMQALLLLGYLFGYHAQEHPRLFRVLAVLLWLAALGALVALWCIRPLEEGIYALLAMVVFYSAFAYPPLFLAWEEEGSAVRLVSFFSFSAALLLAALVAVAIAIAGGDCDCDGADCCYCGGGSDGKKKKKR